MWEAMYQELAEAKLIESPQQRITHTTRREGWRPSPLRRRIAGGLAALASALYPEGIETPEGQALDGKAPLL